MHPSACEQGPGNQKIPLELLIPSFKEAAAAQAGGLGVCRKEGPGSTSWAQGAPAGLLGPFCHLLGGGTPTNLHPRCHCTEATVTMEPCPQVSLSLLRRDTKDKASQTMLLCEDKILTQTCEKVGTQLNKNLSVALETMGCGSNGL